MSNGVIIRPRFKLMQLLPPDLASIGTSLLVLSGSWRGNVDSSLSIGSDQWMMQEARFPDFLFSKPLTQMNPFLLFLVSVSCVRVSTKSDADLLLRALPLDGFLGVVGSRRCGMVRLNFKILLLFSVCRSESAVL